MTIPISSLHFDMRQLLTERLSWQPFRPGIQLYSLYGETATSASAALLRYAPGAKLPTHEHVGFEHVWILEGSQRDEHGEYQAGSLVVNPPGTRHSVSSPDGCVVLVTWEKPVQFSA